MYIEKVILNNFRNYEEQIVEFNKNINVIYGDNAQGKTNILEAIFLSAFGKSFRTSKEKELIKLDKEFLNVSTFYKKSDREGKIQINISNKKEVKLNGVKLKKLSELLGNINLVIFTPDDINILKDGPAKRRRFLDMMIGQLRPNYVYVLNQYLKTIEQRNNYLRQIKEQNVSTEMLDIWNEKLAEYAIKYLSDCSNKEGYLKLLKERTKLDIIKGYTTKGIHRDDFVVYINEKEVNIYGSQGQNRTVILTLKLSELQVIYEEIGEYPILLLDDFMSELDEKRRNNFLNNIKNTQVIITCTDKLELNKLDYKLFNVKKGEIY